MNQKHRSLHCHHFPSLLLSVLFLHPTPLLSSIVPYGNIGDPPLFILDVSLSQNQYECIYFDGVGEPSDTFIQLYFEQFNEIHSQASDFLFTLSPLFSSTPYTSPSSCMMQGGYNQFPSLCEYLKHWNQSWTEQRNILVQDNIYAPSNVQGDSWKFCVSNGWAGSQEFVRYQALVVMFGIEYEGIWNQSAITSAPTSSPTVAPTQRPTTQADWKNTTYESYDSKEILSSCDETPVKIQFDATLSSNEQSCVTFFGSGNLSSLKITILNYTLHSPSIIQPEDIYQSLSDLAITLTNTQPSNTNGNKIQFGGLQYLDDSIQGTLLPWPQSFQNLALSYSSSSEIEITIPSDRAYDLGSTDSTAHYELCVHNTYSSHTALPATYHSLISLPNIQFHCNGILETIAPTSSPTVSPTSSPLPSSVIYHSSAPDSVLLSVDLYLQSDSRECIELILGGALTSIHTRLSFQGNDLDWASDMILSIEALDDRSFSSSSSSSCYQVEGQTALFHLEDCSSLAVWPNEFNQLANGFYEVILDLQKPLSFGDYSTRKVSPHISISFLLSSTSADLTQICFTSSQSSEDTTTAAAVHYNGTIVFNGLQTSPVSDLPLSPALPSFTSLSSPSPVLFTTLG
jgi:hypothetical protein